MFVKAEKKHIDIVYEYLRTDLTDDTTYAALSILGWMLADEPYVEIDEKYVVVRFKSESGYSFLTPLVKNKEDFKYAVEKLVSYKAEAIYGVTDWQVEIYNELGYTTSYTRNTSEYLYDPEKMITLSGKKLHSKRNFINSFPAEYEFKSYEGDEEDYKNIIEMFCKWCYWRTRGDIKPCKDSDWRNSPEMIESGYTLEANALELLLRNQEAFNAFTDMLIIDGKVEGFVTGEVLPNGIGVIYFEKGNVEFRGMYPLIDNLFCKKHFDRPDVRYVNKQEDMGLEGLRKSKESYRPVKLAERYVAVRQFGDEKVSINTKILAHSS